MKKSILALIVAAIVVTGSAIGIYSLDDGNQSAKPVTQTKSQTQSKNQTVIEFSSDKKTVKYDGLAGQTALSTLQSLTTVETKSTSFGDMVIGINGLKANEASEYWAFYVNGQLASEGAGTYLAKAGDKIEWHLEKL